MVIFDKASSGNTMIVTSTEGITLPISGTTGFTLNIVSDFDNQKQLNITLTDVSLFTERYNEFEFDNTILDNLNTGLYTYSIFFFNETEDEIVEFGILRIIDTTPDTSKYKYTKNDDKEFYTYKK